MTSPPEDRHAASSTSQPPLGATAPTEPNIELDDNPSCCPECGRGEAMTAPSGAIIILHESGCPTLPPPGRDDFSTMRRNPEPSAHLEEIRQFVEDGILVTAVIVDPADAQQTRYGIVTRCADGTLVGTYHPCDLIRQEDWRVVTSDGSLYEVNNEPACVVLLISLA